MDILKLIEDNSKEGYREILKVSGNYKKTYHEILNELSSDDIFDGLLGYGLFNEKIPNFLTSETFLTFCKNLPKNLTLNSKPSGYVNYDTIRNINIPRVLSIPSPISYYHQCRVLSDNWNNILKHFKNNTIDNEHKVSRIHVRKIDTSYKIFEMNYKNHSKDGYPEPKLLIGKKYIVKADISTYYPSIYTHSIPWALIGKDLSKKEISNDNEWFNKIDRYTRNLKNAETHGILIGCHSSNIISEIILTTVDKIMHEKGYRYIRNIDDYTCYTKDMDDSEQFLMDLSFELKKYGLLLNNKKTEILRLPQASTEHWIRKLNSFVFKENVQTLSHVRSYLDIAINLMTDNNENSAILNYAIKVLSKKEMNTYAKDYFIDTIHHLILIYPYLIHLLDCSIFTPFKIKLQNIEKISNDLYTLGVSKNISECAIYAIFFSLKYDFKLNNTLFDEAMKMDDTVLLLLSYLHDKKYLNKSADFNRTTIGKKYKTLAKTMVDNIDEYWVFVYEVLSKDQLKDEWKKMKECGISFIQKDYNIKATK
jgi:hypothetical protein